MSYRVIWRPGTRQHLRRIPPAELDRTPDYGTWARGVASTEAVGVRAPRPVCPRLGNALTTVQTIRCDVRLRTRRRGGSC